MKRRTRRNRTRTFNILDSRAVKSPNPNLEGFWFVLQPNQDPCAWQAIQYYAQITPNAAQKQALRKWLAEHPDPAAPQLEQMEMEMEL